MRIYLTPMNAMRSDGKTWNYTTIIGDGLYAVARDNDENVVIIGIGHGRVFDVLATVGRSDVAYRVAVAVAVKVDREEIAETEAAINAAYTTAIDAHYAAAA